MKAIHIADLFCGAGGASTAARRASQALRLRTELLAVNHWPVAIETHTLNHPDVRHLCASIDHVNPREAVPGGRLQLLLAAPECTFFSTARGGRPVTDQQRTQPYVILKWLQELYVENVLIENVPEFESWGPVGANGKPLKRGKRQLFDGFLELIRRMDYTVDYRILNAADYGDPTTRRRLFIIARRGKKPIAWPTPSHSRNGHATLFGPTQKWRAAREVIDWSLTGQSIFGRKRPLSPKTMARIMAGLERFGGKDLQPFLVLMRGTSDGQVANSARSLDDPLTTLTGGGGHHALCEPFVIPVTHGGGEARSHDVDEPLPTITCANRGELAVIEPFVLPQQSGGVPRSTDDPWPTIATDGAQMLIEPFILPPRHMNDGAVDSVDAPLRTITAASGHVFGVVEPFMVPHYGERPGQPPRTHSVDEPVPTIPASGDGKFEVVQAFIMSAGGPEVAPRSTDEPMNTVLTRDHVAVVQPFIVGAGGSEYPGKPTSIDEPMRTVTANDHHALVEPRLLDEADFVMGDGTQAERDAFIASYYGTENVSSVSAPLPTVTTKDRFALVMPVVNGRALDVRLRMLKPHELAAAMSFGADYKFAGNQGEKVKQIGNAWPCRLGQALIHAILEPYAATRGKTRRLEVVA